MPFPPDHLAGVASEQRRGFGMIRKFFLWLVGLGFTGLVLAVAAVLGAFWYFGQSVPDHSQLAGYQPATVTRVHAGDGRLLAQFAVEERFAVPISAIPKRVVAAFLSAEDKSFYQHPGIDLPSIGAAVIKNVLLVVQGRRPVGASTITQQVAKNFLLTNEVSIERKIKEAIIALRLEQAYSKDRILELYLNEIYLGRSAYGVAVAALNYFDKSLDELTVAEAAYLAALPKAPNNYNPITKKPAALARRNWVLDQMRDNGYIDAEQAVAAKAEDLVVRERGGAARAQADYFVEEVRRELAGLYGDDVLYKGGLSVRTTLDPQLQSFADKALQDGLIDYDRRHGWRGPLAQLDSVPEAWHAAVEAFERPAAALPEWETALVLAVQDTGAVLGFADGRQGQLPFSELTWARPWLEEQKVGARPKRTADVLTAGDFILVEAVVEDAEGKAYPENSYGLRQIPAVNGGIVAMDPHTGRVLAMSGGFSFGASEFNRATQATRQPGSAFKPFVYLGAFEEGFTPATIVLDAPITIDQGEELGKWKPANYSEEFYGPSPLRLGVEKSRNLMTVRLAQQVGMRKVKEVAERFGIVDNLEPVLAMALGSGETTVLRLTRAYSELVNGGKAIEPTFIDRVQNRQGQTIFRHDQRRCEGCLADVWQGQDVPVPPDTRAQLADPAVVYQIVSLLEGAVQRGTGVRLRELGIPLAGKTGTTNDSRDTWFMGLTPDLAVGVFVGFDTPLPMGAKETGSSVALPVFKGFMAQAMQQRPAVPFRIPPGIRLVWVDRFTGERSNPGAEGAILEAFQPGTEPAFGEAPRVLPDVGSAVAPSAAGTAPAAGDKPLPPSPSTTGTIGSGIY